MTSETETAPTPKAETEPRRSSGLGWPVAVGGVLMTTVSFYVVLIMLSVNDPSFVVKKGYYEKALAWDQTVAQRQENKALGWQVELTALPAGEVALNLTDPAGQPVTGAEVTLSAYHNARALRVFESGLRPAADGYAGELEFRRRGLHTFKLTAVKGERRFETTFSQDVGL